MIKYAEPTITAGDMVWIERVLATKWLTQGPIVPKLEDMVREYVGAKYAVAFNSATSALFAAYTVTFEPGEKVWMTPVTFVATASAAVHASLEPVFTDMKEAENLAVVHMAGAWRGFEGKNVVEDAAHAFGSSGAFGRIGNCARSRVCVFSTHAIKNFTTGEGGIATTNSKAAATGMRLLRDHGRVKGRCMIPGWNFRMTDIQAALGVSQLGAGSFKRFEEAKERRHAIAAEYTRELASIVETPGPWSYDTFLHLYRVFTKKRDSLQRHLAKREIQTAIHYPLVYSQPAFRKSRRFNTELAEDEAKTCLSLPLHNNLTDEDVATVIKAVKEWKR